MIILVKSILFRWKLLFLLILPPLKINYFQLANIFIHNVQIKCIKLTSEWKSCNNKAKRKNSKKPLRTNERHKIEAFLNFESAFQNVAWFLPEKKTIATYFEWIPLNPLASSKKWGLLKENYSRKSNSSVKHDSSINPYSTNVPLPYPLKVSENFRFSDVFKGYRSGKLVENGLKRMTSTTKMASNKRNHFN